MIEPRNIPAEGKELNARGVNAQITPVENISSNVQPREFTSKETMAFWQFLVLMLLRQVGVDYVTNSLLKNSDNAPVKTNNDAIIKYMGSDDIPDLNCNEIDQWCVSLVVMFKFQSDNVEHQIWLRDMALRCRNGVWEGLRPRLLDVIFRENCDAVYILYYIYYILYIWYVTGWDSWRCQGAPLSNAIANDVTVTAQFCDNKHAWVRAKMNYPHVRTKLTICVCFEVNNEVIQYISNNTKE